MSAAHDQLARVQRYLDRFKELNDGLMPARTSTDYYIDDVYSFFQHCHHLKDWIKNDEALPLPKRNGAEGHLAASDDLKLCADIANGTKHLLLTRKTHSGADPQFNQSHQRHYTFDPATGRTTSVRVTLQLQGNTLDCYELATRCVRSWENYLA
jgi:hypothetical protein